MYENVAFSSEMFSSLSVSYNLIVSFYLTDHAKLKPLQTIRFQCSFTYLHHIAGKQISEDLKVQFGRNITLSEKYCWENGSNVN